MNESAIAAAPIDPPHDPGANTIDPLPGEPGIPNVAERARPSMSKKGLLAVALLILSLVAVSALSIQRFAASGKRPDADKRLGDQPTAAAGEPRRLDMSLPIAVAPRIPALVPTPEERAEPIGVHRTGTTAPAPAAGKAIPPEDAPVVLVSTRPGARTPPGGIPTHAGDADRLASPSDGPDSNDPLEQSKHNLDAYQRQLQGLLESLTRTTAGATGDSGGLSSLGGTSIGLPSVGGTSTGSPTTPPSGLFGGQLQGSATPRVAASLLGDRSLTLPKGTAFTCALKTKIVSAVSGFVGCQVQRNVFSDDGRVLLIERGSHMDGEYRIASVRPGTVRIPVLWTRIRTPNGVTVDIDSPGTGPLGESGVDGYVDNRWGERIGAAMLMSLIDDSVKLIIQNQANDTNANTVVLPSTTTNTSKLAEKVLDSTINIPPLIYQNQGGIVGIYVARDVDFSSVYELRPTADRGRP